MSNVASAAGKVAVATGGSFNPLTAVFGFFDKLKAARRIAAAIRASRRPAERDLRLLGMTDLDFGNLSR